ncbi:hypothetical protein [Alysiella filiformis]|nr:hypothetical protein [Alysiella filiformis]
MINSAPKQQSQNLNCERGVAPPHPRFGRVARNGFQAAKIYCKAA